MKKIFLLLSLFSAGVFAQNLISTSNWTEGNVPSNSTFFGGYSLYGAVDENSIVNQQLNDGSTGLVWKAAYNGSVTSTSNQFDGGFNSPNVLLNGDYSSAYMFSVWIKRSYSSTITYTYFGVQGNSTTSTESNMLPLTNQSSGTNNFNPYFFSGVLPQAEKWYLLVGYIRAYNDLSTNIMTSLYDGVTKQKVSCPNCRDFRFPDPTTRNIALDRVRIRTFLNGRSNPGDAQYHYDPRIYKMNGLEPTIDQLLGVNVSYSNKVAINTYWPLGDYELAVNGEIIAKEVNVNLNGPWPDYVFENDYNLKSIEEVEAYIKSNKHLPEVPSAEEVCKEGIFLGDMNAKLLKKIEELTLYVIEQNKQIKTLQVEVEELKKK